MEIQFYHHPEPFVLESGEVIPGLRIAWQSFGQLNRLKNNVVWLCHALTGNSDPTEWWKGIAGDGCVFDPEEHFIVCANVIGSCYGSTGPADLRPHTGRPWFHLFPEVTIRDLVKAHQLLAKHLGIAEIAFLAGGSLGGQQALEWAVQEPERIKRLVLLATSAVQSPWALAFNESQRMAIRADSSYFSLDAHGGKKGLRAARAIAMLSYRNYACYEENTRSRPDTDQAAVTYQRHQGDKLVARFSAYSYVCLTQAMDSHDIGKGKGGVAEALKKVSAETLVIGISSDLLFPVNEQKTIAAGIPGSVFREVDSLYGHDGFLVETRSISSIIRGHFAGALTKKEKSYNYFNI